MIKLRYVAATALAAALSAPAVFAADGQGISSADSPHNFYGEAWNVGYGGSNGDICTVCHAPHDHGRTLFENGYLWNHQLATTTYVMYSSDSLDGAQDAQPTGVAKLCLGCHDGSVGVDQFGSTTPGTVFLSSIANSSGTDQNSLAGVHPISIVYDPSADSGLNPTSTVVSDSDTGATSGTIADILFDGSKVQCASCHDVHNTLGETVPNTALLRVNKRGTAVPSELCLTCHNK